MELLFILMLGLVFGLFCSFIAKQKNRDIVAWFFLGFFFSFIALLALIAVPKLEEQKKTTYTCSSCGIKVSADDKNCPNCGLSFEGSEEEIKQTKFCNSCGEELNINAKFCTNCGNKLTK